MWKADEKSLVSKVISISGGALAGFFLALTVNAVKYKMKVAIFHLYSSFLQRMRGKFVGTLRQSVMALSFNVFGIAAGTIVAFHLGLFDLAPWAVVIYPPLLSARGVIGGLLSGRLSTGLHLGTVQPRFIGNTKSFYLLFQAIVVLTFESSVAMSVFTGLFGSFLWGMTAADFVCILGVIIATMTLSLAITSPLTMIVSFLSFRHGLDPDIILYPVESTSSDILITVCYLLVLNLFFTFGSPGRYLIGFLSLVLLSTAAYAVTKNAREGEFTKTVEESFLTLVFVAFIVNVTGSVLGEIAKVVRGRREIYIVYPSTIDTIGDVGSVVGSTATTKLALGTLKSSFSDIRNHTAEIFGVWVASLIMFVAYSVLSFIIQGTFALPVFLRFLALLLSANVMAASFIIIIAYAVAILAYQKGLDPDNFVIPIESSLADTATTTSLLIALSLIG